MWQPRARVLGSLRRYEQLAVRDGKVVCPLRCEELDIERCGQCPWVVAVSVEPSTAGTVAPGAAGTVTCRRPRMLSPSVF